MTHDRESQTDYSAGIDEHRPVAETRIAVYLRESLVDAHDRERLRELLGTSPDAAFIEDARQLLVEEGHAVDSMTDADLLATVERMLVSGELFLLRDDPILTFPEAP